MNTRLPSSARVIIDRARTGNAASRLSADLIVLT